MNALSMLRCRARKPLFEYSSSSVDWTEKKEEEKRNVGQYSEDIRGTHRKFRSFRNFQISETFEAFETLETFETFETFQSFEISDLLSSLTSIGNLINIIPIDSLSTKIVVSRSYGIIQLSI